MTERSDDELENVGKAAEVPQGPTTPASDLTQAAFAASDGVDKPAAAGGVTATGDSAIEAARRNSEVIVGTSSPVEVGPQQPKKRSKGLRWVALLILLALVVAASVVLWRQYGSCSAPGPEKTNVVGLANGAPFAVGSKTAFVPQELGKGGTGCGGLSWIAARGAEVRVADLEEKESLSADEQTPGIMVFPIVRTGFSERQVVIFPADATLEATDKESFTVKFDGGQAIYSLREGRPAVQFQVDSDDTDLRVVPAPNPAELGGSWPNKSWEFAPVQPEKSAGEDASEQADSDA